MAEIPIFEAKNQFTRIVHEAEGGGSFRLTRHGKPAAMLIGMDEYERLNSSHVGLAGRLDDWRKLWDGILGEDGADDPFAGLRSHEAGRAVEL